MCEAILKIRVKIFRMKIEGSHTVLFLKSNKVKFAVFLHKLYEHLSIPLPEVGLVSISTRRGNSSMPVSRFGPKGGSISSLITSLGEQNIRTLTEGISRTVMDAIRSL